VTPRVEYSARGLSIEVTQPVPIQRAAGARHGARSLSPACRPRLSAGPRTVEASPLEGAPWSSR
jgi:hypothetical protein